MVISRFIKVVQHKCTPYINVDFKRNKLCNVLFSKKRKLVNKSIKVTYGCISFNEGYRTKDRALY